MSRSAFAIPECRLRIVRLDTQEATLTVIDRNIALDGPLGEDQRARLLEIANRCPVHLTLSSKTEIRTRLQ